jgi:hypothetical protein
MRSTNLLQIEFDGGRTAYRPGDVVTGHAAWQVEEISSVEVRFLWYTGGQGTFDMQVVASTKVDNPQRTGRTPFRYQLRDSPYSFSGSLVSLQWAVDVVIEPGDRLARAKFVMAPDAKEIQLLSLPRKP